MYAALLKHEARLQARPLLSFLGIALAVFAYQVFRPHGGAMMEILERHGLLWRTRFVWFGVLVMTPLALAGVALVGYTAVPSSCRGA